MIRFSLGFFITAMLPLALASCADTEPKPAGPQSGSSALPWNTPVAGQGQGQFGMLPQNQYRR
ncbi:MAG: hypothetical protein ACNA8L_09375 [Luteolibacter sp.]